MSRFGPGLGNLEILVLRLQAKGNRGWTRLGLPRRPPTPGVEVLSPPWLSTAGGNDVVFSPCQSLASLSSI